MMVMSVRLGTVTPSASWRKRVSPFSTNGLALMTQLYDDLARSVPLDGIVFGDDAYLTDGEDLNPMAVARYRQLFGVEEFALNTLSDEQKITLTELKSKRLDDFCRGLMTTVRAHRPEAKFVRTLYAPVLHYPPCEEWLAQSYGEALRVYDQVLVLADPEMEGLSRASAWLMNLVKCVGDVPGGAEKTVFRLQTYSERRKCWLSGRQLAGMVRRMSSAGARHFVLGPDDVTVDRPRLRGAKKVFQAGS
jgi:biofilm PGA synthesis lipoprotein PgaB